MPPPHPPRPNEITATSLNGSSYLSASHAFEKGTEYSLVMADDSGGKWKLAEYELSAVEGSGAVRVLLKESDHAWLATADLEDHEYWKQGSVKKWPKLVGDDDGKLWLKLVDSATD